MPFTTAVDTAPTSWPLPFLLVDLHLPEEWSYWSVGFCSGCSVCLQRQRVAWLRQHQELQSQGRLSSVVSVLVSLFPFVALEPHAGLDVWPSLDVSLIPTGWLAQEEQLWRCHGLGHWFGWLHGYFLQPGQIPPDHHPEERPGPAERKWVTAGGFPESINAPSPTQKTAFTYAYLHSPGNLFSFYLTALTQLRKRCRNLSLPLSSHVRNFKLVWESRSIWAGFPGLLSLKGVGKSREIKLTLKQKHLLLSEPLIKLLFQPTWLPFKQETLSNAHTFPICNLREVPTPWNSPQIFC